MLNKWYSETGSGGSLVVYENDYYLDRGMFTDIYLKLFSTVTAFWANNVFDIDINSETEKALRENSLDAKGKENIKRAVKSDLSKIGYATFDVQLTSEYDKLNIKITAENNGVMQIVWDFTQSQDIEITIQDTVTGTPLLSEEGFFLLTESGQKLTTE